IPALAFSLEARAMETARQTDALVRGNNAFALDLYGKLGQDGGNRFFAPLSISTALAMTYAGAEGETAGQMAKTLHFDLPAEKLHASFHRLAAELSSRTSALPGSTEIPDVQLFSANALWCSSVEPILSDFRKRIEVNYRGGIHPADFLKAAEPSRQAINAWALEQTRGKIKDLLGPGSVDSRTILVLANAIYFKALWAAPFRSEGTRPGNFQTSSGEKARVAMMNQTERFRYLDGGSFQALELPYKGDTIGMVIFLPKAADGLPMFESSLGPEKLAGWLAGLSSQRVQVSIPKFRLTGEFNLKDALTGLGMTDAFRPGVADFSGMSGTREIAISAVVHKACVEVEEKGTEAAAATGIAIVGHAMLASPPTVFRADHPFFFLIRDLRSSSILFLGRLVQPES
ncbi:MAG: serpin family protein, partial [Isosphaeraceae bacterium]